MYVADLDVLPGEFGISNKALAVGWLEPPAAIGPRTLTKAAFEALVELCIDPWQPFVTAGRYQCRHCRYSDGPSRLQVGDRSVSLDGRNLFLPGKDVLFVAPVMIVHYIDAHAYNPPGQFAEAVLACPPMRSMAYLKALRALGVKAMLPPQKG